MHDKLDVDGQVVEGSLLIYTTKKNIYVKLKNFGEKILNKAIG